MQAPGEIAARNRSAARRAARARWRAPSRRRSTTSRRSFSIATTIPGAVAVVRLGRRRGQHLDPLLAERQLGAGPGLKSPHQAVERLGFQVPPCSSLVFSDLRRHRDSGLVLRLRPRACRRRGRAGSRPRSGPPTSARRRLSSPAVSRAPIASSAVSSIGPLSSPSSISIVVTPVTGSPAAIAAWIGAAPRQRGRSEAWRLTQPSRGSSRRARGKSCPKATTTATSGASFASRARKAGSRTFSTCSQGIPSSRAASTTGGSVSRCPRFAGRDGCETTSTGRNSLAASARNVGTANSGVPKKTVLSLIRPTGYTLAPPRPGASKTPPAALAARGRSFTAEGGAVSGEGRGSRPWCSPETKPSMKMMFEAQALLCASGACRSTLVRVSSSKRKPKLLADGVRAVAHLELNQLAGEGRRPGALPRVQVESPRWH